MTAAKQPDTAATPKPYTVTRALCMGGERVEVGTVLELNRAQASEMLSANKVTPFVAPEPEPAAAEPKAKPAKARAAEPETPAQAAIE